MLRSLRSAHAAARGAAVVAVWLAALCPAAGAQSATDKSPAAVKELTQLLAQAKLDSVAAADPQNLGTYVAALYFPGAQLLVVSAKYAAPPLLNEKISHKSYRDVYIDLNSASIPASKLFVMDQNADGLVAKPIAGAAPDSIERAGTQITFDGAWKKAKMSEADYYKNFNEADAAYTHALQLLIAQLKSGG